MKKLINVEKLTENKFLNLYKFNYSNNNSKYSYFVSSRRDLNNLEVYKNKVDAVRVVPYIIKDNKIYIVLIKEFRHAINDYIFGVVAGLVDGNENCETAIARELKEEIGAKVLSLKKVLNTSYSSAGLTDETLVCYYANVELCLNQNLDDNEEITFQLIELSEILNFIDKNKFCMQSALLLKSFYYECKLKLMEKN